MKNMMETKEERRIRNEKEEWLEKKEKEKNEKQNN